MNIIKKLFGLFKKTPKPIKRKLGWKKDVFDPRDFKYKVSAPETPKAVPSFIDLRPLCPPVYNQLDLGSCTGNALAGAHQFEQIKQKEKDFIPSRLFIYYNERTIENTIDEDSGAQIRDGIKSLASSGVCPETMWKYITSKFTTKPTPDCYNEATKHKIVQYLRISDNTLQGVKEALADGYPVAFGFTVYSSFMSNNVAKTGNVPIPTANDEIEGGHAVLAVGYDDSKEALIVRNSWSSSWGINGYFYLPYWYITTPNASNDFWVIKLVE